MTVDCKWTRVRIPALVDGELDAADRSAVESHVASCPSCGRFARIDGLIRERARAVAASEKAPAALADRIRAGLAREAAAPRPARRNAWVLALAAAAAALFFVAFPWGGRGMRLVSVMASEHAGHVADQQYHNMELLSDVDTELEAFLSRELGTSVVLPPTDIPPRRAAHCGEREGIRLGVVGCFCQRRGKAVTVFVMSSRGLDTSGLARSERQGVTIFHGASRSCRVAIWAQGDLFYALAGELEADDLLDMAARASAALAHKLQG